jgi:tetratricopeptide (TPR) repeat protein
MADAEKEYQKGLEYDRVKNFKDAEKEFRKAVTHDPTMAKAWNMLGKELQEQKKEAEALQALDKAISLSPRLVDAYFNKGFIYYKMGNFKEAMTAFENTMEYSSEILLNAQCVITFAKPQQEDYLIPLAKKFITIIPFRYEMYETLLKALEQKKDYQTAIMFGWFYFYSFENPFPLNGIVDKMYRYCMAVKDYFGAKTIVSEGLNKFPGNPEYPKYMANIDQATQTEGLVLGNIDLKSSELNAWRIDVLDWGTQLIPTQVESWKKIEYYATLIGDQNKVKIAQTKRQDAERLLYQLQNKNGRRIN